MNKKLYRACLNAGLSKAEISRIENAYDAERKKMKRNNEAMERYGIVVTTFSALEEMDNMMERVQFAAAARIETPDEIAVGNERRDILADSIRSLSADDREFINMLFFEFDGNVSKMADRLGIPRETVRDRNKRILVNLKKKFTEKGYFDTSF